MDAVAFGNGIAQSLEDKQNTSFGSAVSIGACIKGLAASSRAQEVSSS